ncbi:hypothetical protein FQA39_LY02794 [Lamprigera yunnana]|nr:hypothetical protein FQA39_LY02794 [Lamprigera yunnana]
MCALDAQPATVELFDSNEYYCHDNDPLFKSSSLTKLLIVCRLANAPSRSGSEKQETSVSSDIHRLFPNRRKDMKQQVRVNGKKMGKKWFFSKRSTSNTYTVKNQDSKSKLSSTPEEESEDEIQIIDSSDSDSGYDDVHAEYLFCIGLFPEVI